MAIRYSGDAQVRVQFDRRRKVYRVGVRAPGHRFRFTLREDLVQGLPGEPAGYDDAARIALQAVDNRLVRLGEPVLPLERGRGGRIVVRRVFQSACPVGRWR